LKSSDIITIRIDKGAYYSFIHFIWT